MDKVILSDDTLRKIRDHAEEHVQEDYQDEELEVEFTQGDVDIYVDFFYNGLFVDESFTHDELSYDSYESYVYFETIDWGINGIAAYRGDERLGIDNEDELQT